jgi:hypothetical protein
VQSEQARAARRFPPDVHGEKTCDSKNLGVAAIVAASGFPGLAQTERSAIPLAQRDRPPAGIDPGITVPPVGGCRTPVIPPPGTPGGDPNVVPKQ